MKKAPSFELFKKTFSKASGKPENRFVEKYGNVSFEDAYPVYVAEIEGVFLTASKIKDFELFLIGQGVATTQSNVSESRYYIFGGVKYRFSAHVYPTGSMTSDTCVDFAADPEMIHTIVY